jgi:hypothetical protein
MAKITEIARDSRNGGCPAVLDVDGDVRLVDDLTIPDEVTLVVGYGVADPDVVSQVTLDRGETVIAVPASLILTAADQIRARR